MAINVASDTVPQGSFGFNLGLTFQIPGFVGTNYHDVSDTWEVRIVNPEGILLVKTSGITFPDPTLPQIFIPITTGDLDKAGVYTFQVAKTTAGSRMKSEVGVFTVEESAPSITY